MGLRDIIGSATGGGTAEWTTIGNYLRDHYIADPSEKTRRAEAAKRDAYYEGRGDSHIVSLIQVAFKDLKNRRLRSDLVQQAKWNNVLKRVSHETATVYSEPAQRHIAVDDERYQEFAEVVGIDAAMRELDRRLVYHEDAWIQYRVRKEDKEPVIEIVSPASFWAVSHPLDRTHLIAIIVDESPGGAPEHAPHYRVLCKDETFMLDAKCTVIQETVKPHGLGRIPGVLASTRPAASKGRLLAEAPAADLVAAHETVWFLNVLLVKESKSATKQTVFTGDTSVAALGQSSDTESDVVMPEGVNTQTLDRGMDLAQFRDNADHILERAGANHGLPPSVLHHRDSSSGSEVHLRRIPLRELRRQRIPIMRRVERALAQIQSDVNATDLPDYAFSPEGWGIDFGEVQQPLTETEADAVFEERRRLGLTSTLDEIMRRNPDIKTHEDAAEVLHLNIQRETARVIEMKELMAVSGAMGTPAPSENDRPQGESDESDLAAIAKEILNAAN
jgi:hypothetical protein